MFSPGPEHPGSLLLLAAGVLTFLGLLGGGRGVLRAMRCTLDEPWETTLAAVTGALGTGLLVQSLAILGGMSAGGGKALWWGIAAVGAVEAVRALGVFSRQFRWQEWSGTLPVLTIGALGVLLLIALAPSSKIDELYYHMLAPRRLLEDGQLRFYRFPWQSGILPQMPYQLLQVTLAAIGLADAANVVSWCYALLLAWFILRLGGASSPGSLWRWGAAAASCVGMAPAVWHVAAGPHALGNLASMALIVLAVPGIRRWAVTAPEGPRRLLAASILAVGAVATKITLLPLAAFCLVATALDEGRRTGRLWNSCCKQLALTAVVTGVCLGPLIVFTAWHSGSPWGIVAAGLTGPPAYQPEEPLRILSFTRTVNSVSIREFMAGLLTGYSPLVIAALFVVLTQGTRPAKLYWWGLVASVTVLLLAVTQNDLRFAGGLPYAALAVAPFLAESQWSALGAPWLRGLIGLCVAPWLLGMGLYAWPFLETTVGLRAREQFLRERTMLRDDYVALDRLLPASAKLLAPGLRLNAAQAPRRVFFDLRDLPERDQVFVLAFGNSWPELDGAEVSEVVYSNPEAVIVAYRSPGRAARRGLVRVGKLQFRNSPQRIEPGEP